MGSAASTRNQSGREQDERIVLACRLRAAGTPPKRIAALTGLSPDYARAATNRVKDADTQESGEDVAAAYWDYTSPEGGNFNWGRLPPRKVDLKIEKSFGTLIGARVRPPARPAVAGPFSGLPITTDVLSKMMASAAAECAAAAPFLRDEEAEWGR